MESIRFGGRGIERGGIEISFVLREVCRHLSCRNSPSVDCHAKGCFVWRFLRQVLLGLGVSRWVSLGDTLRPGRRNTILNVVG